MQESGAQSKIHEVHARSLSRNKDRRIAEAAFNSGVTLLNPITDASERQVLFSNQLLPMEQNLRRILKHYDQYGFGKGFEITKPKREGEFSGPIQLEQRTKSVSPLKRGQRVFDSDDENEDEPVTDIKLNQKKTRNFENKLTLTKGYTSPAKPPLPNRRKLKISDSEGSNSTVSDLDISNVWNYNSEAPTKASERNLTQKKRYPPSLTRLKTLINKAKESPTTQSLQINRSPLKLKDIDDARSKLSISPETTSKLNSSYKSRNLKFSTFKPESHAFTKMEAVENTEYLNGYYWSLNPDLLKNDSENQQNIICLKSTKSGAVEGFSSTKDISYMSRSGICVLPIRSVDSEYSRNYKLTNSSMTSEKLKSLIKQRYQSNLSKIEENNCRTPLMNRLVEQKRRNDYIFLKEKQRRNKLKEMASTKASDKGDEQKLDRDSRQAIYMQMDEIEKAIYDKSRKKGYNMKLNHQKQRIRYKELQSVPIKQETAKEIAKNSKKLKCLALKKRVWAGAKGLFTKNDLKTYFKHFDDHNYNNQLKKNYNSQYKAVQSNKKWIYAHGEEQLIDKEQEVPRAKEMHFTILQKELNEYNSVTYNQLQKKKKKK